MLGGAPLGGLFSSVTEDDALATFITAWNGGIRAFDTAPHYGVGLAEVRLGVFLRSLSSEVRGQAVVSSKVGRLLVPTDDNVEGDEGFYGTPLFRRQRDYSRSGVFRSVEESLKRIGLEHLDIALIHDPEEHFAAALDEALPALCELRNQGLVRAIGVGMNQATSLVRFVREAELDCVLVAGRWSLLDRSAGRELLPECERRRIAVFIGGVFNSGVLINPRRGAPYDYAPAPADILARAERLEKICARAGVPLPAAAVQFPLRHRAVTAVVVGARSPREVRDDLAFLEVEIPEETWDDLEGADT
ncbi:MAG TPA: aldo/keto reductase [Acidimicrobiales bacterium]|nr:aldo/keto reductase [Acidimicrobiales bacterium]